MQGREVASGRVYVIDDAPPVRRALERALSEHGHAVTTCEDAEAFFRVAHLEEPAVLVLDMRMPGMTGAELMRRLQDRGRDMPIVFISGESRPDEIVDVMKRGAIDFLVKPFPTAALLAAVGSALERARAALDARERLARARILEKMRVQTVPQLVNRLEGITLSVPEVTEDE